MNRITTPNNKKEGGALAAAKSVSAFIQTPADVNFCVVFVWIVSLFLCVFVLRRFFVRISRNNGGFHCLYWLMLGRFLCFKFVFFVCAKNVATPRDCCCCCCG